MIKVLQNVDLEGTYLNIKEAMYDNPKWNADGDRSYEIKRRLLLGRKVMTNLDNILKSFVNKGLSSQG